MALEIPLNQQTVHSTSDQYRNGNIALRAHSFKLAHTPSEEPAIPAPHLFDQLSEPARQSSLTPIRIPNPSECAAHLKLLQAIHALRKYVLESQLLGDALGIKPEPRTVWRGRRPGRYQAKIKDSTFTKRRDTKWPIYVKFSVLRFLHWVRTEDAALRAAELNGEEVDAPLPPLDILMVWHSCLLNPKDFQLFCKQHSYKHIRKVEFPWAKIHHAINSADWTFTLSPKDTGTFRSTTNLSPNLETYLHQTPKLKIVTDLLTDWSSTPWGSTGLFLKVMANHPLGTDKFFHRCLKNVPGKENIFNQITDAIHRQSTFVDKMHRYLWICSPAASGTLERAVDRYSKFIKLFKVYPNKILVPTLDIDLVWHTHQCSASRYEADMESYTGRFIDHNDKLGGSVLDDGMARTRDLYRIRFGKEYSICLCWDCQAMLSTVEKLGVSQTGSKLKVKQCAERVSLVVTFYREVEKARRAKVALPSWDKKTYGPEYWC
ncbi:hypothetical protein FQN54_000197 [Arachnomyces sp. PD_36]|nr:hypothetical protein FQN54_000197 [Arachnomyces sp. PD_36]